MSCDDCSNYQPFILCRKCPKHGEEKAGLLSGLLSLWSRKSFPETCSRLLSGLGGPKDPLAMFLLQSGWENRDLAVRLCCVGCVVGMEAGRGSGCLLHGEGSCECAHYNGVDRGGGRELSSKRCHLSWI